MTKKTKFPNKKPDNSHLIKAPVSHNWSSYQRDIFRNIGKDTGHLIVEAFAGSAKTSSIVESFRYVPAGKKSLALAFNTKNKDDLKERAPSYIEVATFHSWGYRAIRHRFGANSPVEVDNFKVSKLIRSQLGQDTDYDLVDNLSETIDFCKYTLQDTPSQIDDIINNYGIDVCDMDRGQFINLVIKTLGLCKSQTNIVDYNDMCWFPFVYNLPVGQFDYVYVDEYQDMSKSQLVMAKKACKTIGGRMAIFGDQLQALYGWRGADTTIITEIKKLSDTKILPLPISYRCPQSVIALAKNWAPDITCPEDAIEGEIKDITLEKLYDVIKPGSFILSRTNAILIKICMTLIRRGIKANIRGRDIGKQLGHLIKKSKKKKVDAFLKWLEEWKDEEVARLQAKKANTENVLDRVECLTTLCEECKTLDEVGKKINELFNETDEKSIIILSSVHRAKGAERDDVFVLRWTFRTWFDKMHMIEKPNEEANIAYVSVTRAKKRLFIVHKNTIPSEFDVHSEGSLTSRKGIRAFNAALDDIGSSQGQQDFDDSYDTNTKEMDWDTRYLNQHL
jgi:superfamily I DNA/RNA helicase